METITQYSDDYQFFLKHQITIAYSQGETTMFSSLDGERFYSIYNGRQMTDTETKEKCYEIFNNLKNERKNYGIY